MPAVVITGVSLLFLNAAISFIFTCQSNTSADHDRGNKFVQRITRMTRMTTKESKERDSSNNKSDSNVKDGNEVKRRHSGIIAVQPNGRRISLASERDVIEGNVMKF